MVEPIDVLQLCIYKTTTMVLTFYLVKNKTRFLLIKYHVPTTTLHYRQDVVVIDKHELR